MNWIEYVRVLQAYRARFGRMPPSILTEEGAWDHMRSALSEPSADRRAARQDASWSEPPRRRERGH